MTMDEKPPMFETLVCEECYSQFTALNPDWNMPPLFVETIPAPRVETCHQCLKKSVAVHPELQRRYDEHLRKSSDTHLQRSRIAG